MAYLAHIILRDYWLASQLLPMAEMVSSPPTIHISPSTVAGQLGGATQTVKGKDRSISSSFMDPQLDVVSTAWKVDSCLGSRKELQWITLWLFKASAWQWHVSLRLTFFFLKQVTWPPLHFWQCPERGELKYGQMALMTVLAWMHREEGEK